MRNIILIYIIFYFSFFFFFFLIEKKYYIFFFFFQAEDGIRDLYVTGVQMCALPISIQQAALDEASAHTRDVPRTLECMRWLAESNYEIHFAPSSEMSERIIFPVSPNESNGIEDARFVRFVEDDGSVIYYATYTAYNGRVI